MKIGDKEYTEIIIHDDYGNKLFTIMDDGIQFEENIGDDYHAEFVTAASNFEPQCGECSRRKWYQKGYEDAIAARNTKETPIPVIKTTQPHDVKIGAVTFKSGTIVRKCPVCEEWVTQITKYCCKCGQRLTDQ